MKILITGGTGYLARNLKSLFETHNYTVFAPSHKELDLLDYNTVSQYLRYNQFDAVIHTAIRGGNKNNLDTFENTYLPNILMFENLAECLSWPKTPLIIFGSGSEFDRRFSISNEYESSILHTWPIDPYGLSKNIIAKRSLYSFTNIWNLRLFGCFNYDENNTRFIKHSIFNLKNRLPIEIHQNHYMDFFYLDDVFFIINYILHNGGPRNINLVYKEKIDLIHIAELIHKYTNISIKSGIQINNLNSGLNYTGNGNSLSLLPIYNKLIGLEEGIKITCKKLLHE